jgi:hypothetical protein
MDRPAPTAALDVRHHRVVFGHDGNFVFTFESACVWLVKSKKTDV